MTTTDFLAALVLLTVVHPSVGGQCGSHTFDRVTVLETDEPGHVLLNISVAANVSWTIEPRAVSSIPTGMLQWLQDSVVINTTDQVHYFQLNKTLDLEYVYENWGTDITILVYRVSCKETGALDTVFEQFVEVEAVNEFAPQFHGGPFILVIPEDTPVNTLLMTLSKNATDRDFSNQGDIYGFQLIPVSLPWTENMSEVISMTSVQQGDVRVSDVLDYESFPDTNNTYFQFNVVVKDKGGLNDTSNLTIYILDVDDLPPYFFCDPPPCQVFYNCHVNSTFTGVVTSITPGPISARDGDALNYNITYRIMTGPSLPNYGEYLSIDNETGVLSILKPMDDLSSDPFMYIQAVEVSEKARYTNAPLLIKISYPEHTTLTPTVTTPPLNTGFSQEDEGTSSSMVAAIAILAVVVIIAFIVLVAVIFYMKKRSEKPIYPVQDLKDVAEEEEAKGEKPAGGSHSDSGQWSMNGLNSPGPHTSSSAPAHTRLTSAPPNGHLVNGHAKKGLRSKSREKTGTQSQTGLSEDSPRDDVSQPSDTPVIPIYLNTPTSLSHGETGSDVMFEEDDVVENGGPLTRQARRLPPLVHAPPPLSEVNSPRKSRASRRQRREEKQAQEREVVFDGTRTYPIAADESFYTQPNKHKVKMSSRKKKKALHPRYWVSVDNDYSEI